LILDKGADIEANDSEGYTALIWAVDFKHTEIVKLLIRRGADINKADKEKTTPLIFAIMDNNLRLADPYFSCITTLL
jgi:ankyrin repeat protein